MKKLNHKGQTLIEVIIAIAVGTLIITAILGLATRSTRNANFSRANEQASKLSQQGLEVVRNIRDENAAGSVVDITGISSWDQFYTTPPVLDVGGGNDGGGPNGVEFKLIAPATGACTITESWCISDSIATLEALPIGFETFTRRVFIADSPDSVIGASRCHRPTSDYPPGEGNDLDNTEIKQVTVVVSWDDPSGSHEAKVSSCIAPKT